MGIQYTTEDGVTLKRPGAYASTRVVSTPGGVAANGIIFAVGEADSGPSYAEEDDLSLNGFGPDQKADVIAKYGSGQIVDAFVGAVAAANDPQIKGAFTKFFPVKTNTSAKASTTIAKIGGGIYGTLRAKAGGKPGNLISKTITADKAEVLPTTGPIVLVSPAAQTDVTFRVNGGAAVTATLAAAATPTTVQSAIDALNGVSASGGVARGVVQAASTRDITVANISGYTCTFTATVAWAVTPTKGDILQIPTGSDFAAANEGTFVVTAATATVISAQKLANAAGGALVAPSAEGPITAGPEEIEAYSPVVISVTAGAVVPGLGKSLEVANTATGDFAALCYTFNTATSNASASTFVSKSGAPTVITSSQEYGVNANLVRQKDQIDESVVVSGAPILSLGYKGTTAQAVIASGAMTITLTGGGSAGLSPISVDLADFPTIGDLCQYLGSLTDFVAAPSLATYTSVSPLRLDDGTYAFGSAWGAKTGRIKADGANFFDAINGSALVEFVEVIPGNYPDGLPDVSSISFLSGGTRGSTSNADIQGALDALQAVKGNFVVPLFSNDATVDIAAKRTDAGSTYDIASIHTACRAHALQMSQLKRRRRRIALISIKDTFANAKLAAQGMASGRVCMTFQDVKDNNAFGTLTTFQPWMAAIKAAAMQAAGFYKDITHKATTVSSATVPSGGYNYNLGSNVEDALDAGLMPLSKIDNAWAWENDQTTYSADNNNFIYNSLQAMYACDLVAATAEERMEKAFVGQSLADVSATTAITVLGSILDDIRGLKLIAPSDDASRGFKNAQIRIVNGNAMLVAVEIKVGTSIKFIPIVFMVTAISQSATG